MISWIYSNLATIIGAAIIAAIFIAIVTNEVKKRKSGKGGCGCGCDHCGSSELCHSKMQK